MRRDTTNKSTSLTEASDLIDRLRRVLAGIESNSVRSSRIESALAHFALLEVRRRRRKALADALVQKDWIITRLGFLAELDELTEGEADSSVYEEAALLFDEIGIAATSAAIAVRSIADTPLQTVRRHH